MRSEDTQPEIAVRKYMHAAGLRYRLHVASLPGKPDLVFPGRRVALFVNGCFWHQHRGCAAAKRPQSNVDYWNHKLDGNLARDRRQHEELQALGWTVIVIWECETRSASALSEYVRIIFGCHG